MEERIVELEKRTRQMNSLLMVLERSNRRVKRVLMAVCVVVALFVVSAVVVNVGGPRPIRTTGLELVDSRGRTRAFLIMTPEEGYNGPVLGLLDKSGQARLALSADENKGPLLALKDYDGTVRAGLGIFRGTPTFGLGNPDYGGTLTMSETGLGVINGAGEIIGRVP